MIELRPAQPSDAPAIRELTRLAYAKWVPLIGREPLPMGADYDVAVRQHRFDLYYVDSNLVALIETIDEDRCLLIENVAVAPGFQGRGIGSKLLTHAEGVARSLGHSRVRLYTNKKFTRNIELYLGRGFLIDAETDLGGGTVRVDMSKTIA